MKERKNEWMHECVSVLKCSFIEPNKVTKEHYLTRQDNIIYKFSINKYFSSTGQDKSKLQKHICKLLILTATAVSIKLPLQARYVTYLLVSVALICLVLYLKTNFLMKNLYIVLSCLIK